jgi:diguanylate cyclase (GGDEF)-like protein/PAS domain S-box-containing protein
MGELGVLTFDRANGGAFHESVLDAAPVAVMVIERRADTWVLVYANLAFEEHTGFPRTAVLGRDWRLLFAPEGDELSAGAGSSGDSPLILHGRRRDGTRFWSEITLSALPGARGALSIVATLRDISFERAEREQWVHDALHDALTGLANRRQLELRLNRAIARASDAGTEFALLLLDLDGFKPVNDTLGHAAGDEVLKTVAERLARVLRESDLVARVGGDEFALLIESVDDSVSVDEIRARVAHEIARPMLVAGNRLDIACSIGESWFPLHGTDADVLTAQADLHMYGEKRRRRSDVPNSSSGDRNPALHDSGETPCTSKS